MISEYYTVSGRTLDRSRRDPYGYALTRYDFALSIQSGADYRRFRKLWKHAYHELSDLIRNSRSSFRRRHRTADGMGRWRATWPALKRYSARQDLDHPRLDDEVLVWELKAHARFLLALLEAVKASRPRR